MTTPYSPMYRKAFEQYLRKGIPPDVSVKATYMEPFYVWRTQEDDKVRPEHAANDGRAFAKDAPPPTGNPGDAFGCRCWAEPVNPASINVLDLAAIAVAGLALATPAGRAVARIAREALALRQLLKPNELPTEKLPELKPSVYEKPEGVPKDWVESPSNNKKGVRYRDPNNKHNEVRVQKADPQSSNPGQRQDYMVWKKGNEYLDKNGNVVPRESEESHILLKDFKFDPEIFQ